MTDEHRRARDRYLLKNIFYNLEDFNDGFDSSSIAYFNETQFAVVLERVKATKAIGIYGIEPHLVNPKTGHVEFYGVDTFESYNTHPADSNWYYSSFEKFKSTGEKLLYSASFYVPGNYLMFE
jgi:hypothetical protein